MNPLTLIASGAALLIAASFFFWLIRAAKRSGANEVLVGEQAEALVKEQQIAKEGAKHVETPDTVRKLDDGTF